MKKVIEKYKKFIFVFTFINLFALAVNIFNIRANFVPAKGSGEISLFTCNLGSDGFWPFVSYIYDYHYSNEMKGFNGIFYQYGVAEFICYMGILVMFLVYQAYIAKPGVKIQPLTRNTVEP